MKALIVEDDFISRRLLQKIMSAFGECDIAMHGKEALKAFLLAWEEGKPYDVICLDIMLPEMDGQEVLKEIRQVEERMGINCLQGVKVIMTTALDDPHSILQAFRGQCEGYLVKPIDRMNLLQQLNTLGLMP